MLEPYKAKTQAVQPAVQWAGDRHLHTSDDVCYAVLYGAEHQVAHQRVRCALCAKLQEEEEQRDCVCLCVCVCVHVCGRDYVCASEIERERAASSQKAAEFKKDSHPQKTELTMGQRQSASGAGCGQRNGSQLCRAFVSWEALRHHELK